MQSVQFDNKNPRKKWSVKTIILIVIASIIGLNILTMLTRKVHFPLVSIVWWGAIAFFLIRYIKRSKTKQESQPKTEPIKTVTDQTVFTLNGVCPILNPNAGILVVGGAGSGKSKSIVEPIIFDAGNQETTGVVYDFKFPELAKYVESAYKNTNLNRYYVNFDDLSTSDRINPISPEIMKNSSFAREFAGTILNNLNPQSLSKPDFWSDNSLIILTAVFWFLRSSLPQYCTLPHAISLIMAGKTESLIALLQTNPETADMIAPLAASVSAGASNQTAGVVSSLQVALSKINTPEIYYIMGSTDKNENVNIDLNNPDKKGILTVGNNPTLSQTYSPVIGLIITAITKMLNQKDKAKSMVLVDEFPTLILPNIEQLPATARSNKVATILACQDISQIVDKYGKGKADTILSNLGNQFYGRTTNPDTAKRVVDLFGKADKLYQSFSDSKGKSSTSLLSRSTKSTNSSNSYNYQERDLVKAQEVAGLQTGSFYVQLSEGAQKQGKISVPINSAFVQSELPEKRQITDDIIKNNYLKIRSEIADLLSI